MSAPLARFVGSAEYCYANAASMLLASIGETVEPALIECMTAVGAGARQWRHDGMIYFGIVPPDIGLANAFRALGFTVHEQAFEADGPFPVETLRGEVDNGPVLIGPLDARHLTYLPGHASLGGVDHYVLVTGFEDPESVRLHDPKGYPNVRLGVEDLAAAWRGQDIGYARGAFRFWSRPSRSETVSRRDLIERCVDAFRKAYELEAEVPGERVRVGKEAFEGAAKILPGEEGSALAGMLVAFGFPLGARRSHDLAVLLQDDYAELSAVKLEQSLAFVDGYRHLVDGDRTSAARSVMRIGELDEAFRARLSAHSTGQGR